MGLIGVLIACSSPSVGTVERVGGQRSSSASASEVKLSTRDLSRVSDLVVKGIALEAELVVQVVQPSIEAVQAGGVRAQPFTADFFSVTFRVDDYIKGKGPDVISVVIPGPEPTTGADNLDGGPLLRNGREYILFLYEPNTQESRGYFGNRYLTQGGQGRWAVVADGTGVVQELSDQDVVPIQRLVNVVKAEASR